MSRKKDVFICHASEDKDEVARPLAEALVQAGLHVWYDEFSLRLGDPLRQTIEKGLAGSRYGVVIFSRSFFAKKWPQDELDGLFSLEKRNRKVILPVWHGVDKKFLLRRSPILADRKAANTASGIDAITQEILDAVEPRRGHRTQSGRTLSIEPSTIRLGSGGGANAWSVRTPISVYNDGDRRLYAVSVMVTTSGNTNPNEIQLHVDDADVLWHTGFDVGGTLLTQDCSTMRGYRESGDAFLLVFLHTIEPRSARSFYVSGPSAAGKASLEVSSFKEAPPETLRRGNSISVPFEVNENLKVTSMGLLNRNKLAIWNRP